MTTYAHLGFDCSTTGGGAVLLDHSGRIRYISCWQAAKELEGADAVDERIHAIGEWAAGIFAKLTQPDSRGPYQLLFGEKPVVLSCSIESPFFRGAGSAALAEAQGAIKSRWSSRWGKYPPSTVKATARRTTSVDVGKTKVGMIHAAQERFSGRNFRSLDAAACKQREPMKALGDLCDAAWVAETDRLQIATNTRREEG